MKRKFVSGVIILTLSSFLIKVIGFITRIYMSNIMGAEGTGLYQLILSVYAVGASFAVSGISVAVCTLTGAKPSASEKILKSGLLITLTTGVTATVICFLFAEKIAFLTGDIRGAASLRIVSFCFPFVSVFACLTGYFNGKSMVKIPVTGQIVEQAARIITVLFLVEKAMDKGIAAACAAAAVGILAGEGISCLFIMRAYFSKRTYNKVSQSYKRKLLSLSVPAALGGYFNSVLHTAENILIPLMLGIYGMSHSSAVSSLGVIKGMAAPIAYFPNILISSVSTVILPAVSYASERGRTERIKASADALFRLCFLAGGFFAAFFCSFGEEICMVLYKNAEAGKVLSTLGLITPFLYINMVSGSVLYGLGLQRKSLAISILEGVIRICLVALCVPLFGINGYLFSVIISDILACVLNIIAISKACNYKFYCLKYFAAAFLSFLIAAVFGNSLHGGLRYPGVVLSYLFAILMLKIVKISDLKWVKYNIFAK